MKVHGREVKFLRTVWAVNEVAKVCPMNDIGRIMEKLKTKSTVELNETWAVFICALNGGYEMAQKYEDKDYKPNPMTVDELYSLSEEEFASLIREATEAWYGDKITVEVEESKKNEEINETSD